MTKISVGSNRNIETVSMQITIAAATGFVNRVRFGNNIPITTPDGIIHVPYWPIRRKKINRYVKGHLQKDYQKLLKDLISY